MDALHERNTHWDRTSQTIVDDSEVIDADGNNDGRISIGEAYHWAWNHDEWRLDGMETPWLDDNGNGLPTYTNGADQNDPTDGTLASRTWFPFKTDVQHVNIVYKYNVYIKHARLLDFTKVVPYAVSEWDITNVDAVSSIDVCPSLKMDSQGGLHLSYGDYSDRKLLVELRCLEWRRMEQTDCRFYGWMGDPEMGAYVDLNSSRF